MPTTPPFPRKKLAKMGMLKENDFFSALSAQNNYMDKRAVRDFYMGLVRVLTDELRENGIVRMPHIGDFAMVLQKDRMGWSGKERKMFKRKYILKFYSNDSWRKYLNKKFANADVDPVYVRKLSQGK